MFEIPDDRRYMESHEWAATDDGTIRVGISDFAQDELGDVVFVELPSEGDDLAKDEEFGVIESIKAVSDLYAPVSGTVVAVNEELFDRPELVNEDPYGDGWMLEIEPTDESELDDLLDGEAYEAQIE
jgi:glycine cleavage system H protein